MKRGKNTKWKRDRGKERGREREAEWDESECQRKRREWGELNERDSERKSERGSCTAEHDTICATASQGQAIVTGLIASEQ